MWDAESAVGDAGVQEARRDVARQVSRTATSARSVFLCAAPLVYLVLYVCSVFLFTR